MKFQVNEGPTDRLVRLALGVVLFGVAAVATGALFYIVFIVGLIGFVTGLTGFCPTYTLFGISTLRKGAPDAVTGGHAK
jgi:DUF2892 family protein